MMMLLMIFSHPFSMFFFHFVKLNLLVRCEEHGDLFVCLPDPLMHTSGGLAANRFHICASRFDDRLDLGFLLVSEVQASLQTVQHMKGKLSWLRGAHKGAPQPRGQQCPRDGAGEEDERRVKNSL